MNDNGRVIAETGCKFVNHYTGKQKQIFKVVYILPNDSGQFFFNSESVSLNQVMFFMREKWYSNTIY